MLFLVFWVWKWCGVCMCVLIMCDVGGGGGGRMWPVLSLSTDKCFWALRLFFSFLLGSAVFHLRNFVLLFALLLEGFIFLIA